MSEVCFHILTSNHTVFCRWQSAFLREGWECRAFDAQMKGCAGPGRAVVDLVEVVTGPCKTPEQLQQLVKERMPVATVAFTRQQEISNAQIIQFMESGADDFVYSETDERVIVAKLKTYIRRLVPAISAALTKLSSIRGDVYIDRERRIVKIMTGNGRHTELLNLTRTELAILAMLVCNEKQAVSRENILEKLWGGGAADVYSDCINKHIETIRRKLGRHGKRIRTVYGSGYMFV